MSEIRGGAKNYEKDVKGTLQNLEDSIGETSKDITGLTKQINASAKGVYTLTDTAGSDLSEIQTCLGDSGKLLRKSANKLKEITDKLTKAKDNGDYADLEHMIYDNKSGVSAFLSAPVELNTKKIYPIDNYGSSMAPFYSTLFYLDRRNRAGCDVKSDCFRGKHKKDGAEKCQNS